MVDALWITEDYLMSNSVIYENTDMKVLTPNIIHVQHQYIKKLLGSALFNIVQAEINAQTYSARVSTLLNDYLKLVIMNYVMAESASDMCYKWMNKGIVVKTGENSQTISPSQLEFIVDKYKNRAEVFAQRCTNYLLQYNSIYPEYLNGNVTIDSIFPQGNAYRTGISMTDDDSESCLYDKSKRPRWYR